MTTKRRYANKIYSIPLTKVEEAGMINPFINISWKDRGKPVCCSVCNQPCGTLVKWKMDNQNNQLYKHIGC